MKYKIFLLFILNFFLGFGVFAQNLNKNFVQEPDNCLSAKLYPCALRALVSAQTISLTGVSLNLEKGSTVVFYTQKEWRLLEGPLWIRGHEPIQVSAGVAQFSSVGDVWINKVSSDKIIVRNLNGDIKVLSPLLSMTQAIPVGFENWYSIINSDLRLGQGILRPIDPQNFLPEWIKMAKLTKAQAIDYIKIYRKSWHGSVQASADLYQQVVSRQMASVESSEEAQIERQKRLQKEHEKLRQMYRERFEEDKAFRLAN